MYRDIECSAACVADRMGVSKSSFSRIVQACYACNYTELVNAHRIIDACAMLNDGHNASVSVDEIGLWVGFRNRQSFFTAFRKYTGTTPLQYRNKS